MGPWDTTPKKVKERLDKGEQLVIVDVRDPWEITTVKLNVPGVKFIPMREVPKHLSELPKDRDVIVHCHHGGRSMEVVKFLRSKGYEKSWNMAGGIDQWAVQCDPSLQRY